MEKTVIRTENAPAPFQGAPYNQAIRVGDLVFVAGQLGLKPGDTAVEGDIAVADRAGAPQSRRDPRGGRQLARQPRQDERVSPGSRRLRGDERGLRPSRRRSSAGALDVRGREAPLGRARRDRGRRPHVGRGATAPARAVTIQPMPTAIRAYIRSLGIDAYVVGGAVRDELLGLRTPRRGLPRPGRRPGRACARCSSPTAASRTWRCTGSSSACASTRATAGSVRSRPPASSSRRPAPSGRPARAIATSRSSATPRSSSRRTWRGGTSRSTRWRAGSRTAASSIPSAASTTSSRRLLRTVGPTSFERRSAPHRARSAVRLAARLRPRTRDPGPDASGGTRSRSRLGRADRRRASRRTGRASSRSCCSAQSRRAHYGSRATRAS